MKPKHEEVRRMLLLALGCWNDFVNTLNSPLYSKSHLPTEAFFEEIYREFSQHQEIQEALILVANYWGRFSNNAFALGCIGFHPSKPHVVFEMKLCNPLSDQDECAHLVSRVVNPIDQIEFPIFAKELDHQKKRRPSAYDLHQLSKKLVKELRKYERAMLAQLIVPDPLVRAGIELQLVRRGFPI